MDLMDGHIGHTVKQYQGLSVGGHMDKLRRSGYKCMDQKLDVLKHPATYESPFTKGVKQNYFADHPSKTAAEARRVANGGRVGLSSAST